MSFNLAQQKEVPEHKYLGGNYWGVTYDPDEDIFFISDQGGFIPTHEELLGIIQEFCNLYDFITEEEVQEHNNRRSQRYRLEPKVTPPKPKPTKTPLQGFVYLIKYGESNLYKVGLSIDPSRRLQQLQKSSPESLKLLGTIKTDDMVKLEAYFHTLYSSSRHTREWFRLDENQVAEFMRYGG